MSALKLPRGVVVSQLTELHPARPALRAEIIQLNAHKKSLFERSDAAKKQMALDWETVVLAVNRIKGSGSTTQAVRLLQNYAIDGDLEPHVSRAFYAVAVGKDKKPSRLPTRSTIFEKLAAYKESGLDGLIKEHKGRVRIEGGWEGLALELFSQPSKPDISAVHRVLVEVQGMNCSYDQVRAYLNGLPSMLGRMSPARIGKNLYRLTEKAYIRRSTENALPGDVYVADGYRADVYLAHPLTGDIYRPELSVAMDLRSRFIVGWRADEHEGAFAVQGMWAEAFARWNHVPPFLYVDNGSGYKNSFVDDEVTGFYARVGVQQVIHSIPGNPHGKGWIEQFFRIMKDDFLRMWMPDFYCGGGMADEVRNKVVREVKAGRLTPPTLAQFVAAFNDWLSRYHARPHPEDKRVTRGELWAGLEPIAPHATVQEMKREQVRLTVRRASLKHYKREYGHADLHAFNGQVVILEYDLMDDRVAVIRALDSKWICDANLIKSIDVIVPNRLEEKRLLRKETAIKRLQKKIDEQIGRGALLIDAEAIAQGALEGDYTLIEEQDAPINLLDFD